MISRFLNPQGGSVSQNSDPFSLFQREVNRAFDEVFRGFPAVGRSATRSAWRATTRWGAAPATTRSTAGRARTS
jgi:hypothetical protein